MLKNFDEYFADYRHYDNGGRVDKAVLKQAKLFYERHSGINKIKSLYTPFYAALNRGEYADDMAQTHLSITCALDYAKYVKKSPPPDVRYQ